MINMTIPNIYRPYKIVNTIFFSRKVAAYFNIMDQNASYGSKLKSKEVRPAQDVSSNGTDTMGQFQHNGTVFFSSKNGN